MFWTQAKRLYLNFNLSFEYRMYANRIRTRILKSKFENSNFVSHPYVLCYRIQSQRERASSSNIPGTDWVCVCVDIWWCCLCVCGSRMFVHVVLCLSFLCCNVEQQCYQYTSTQVCDLLFVVWHCLHWYVPRIFSCADMRNRSLDNIIVRTAAPVGCSQCVWLSIFMLFINIDVVVRRTASVSCIMWLWIFMLFINIYMFQWEEQVGCVRFNVPLDTF